MARRRWPVSRRESAEPRLAGLWAALGSGSPRSSVVWVTHHFLFTRIARLPGTQPRTGFEVLDSAPAHSLRLAGRHRLARYMLTFDLTGAVQAATHLRAKTRAVSWRLWPGLPRAGHRHPISHRRHHARILRSVWRLRLALA